jgi:hypothetical protein
VRTLPALTAHSGNQVGGQARLCTSVIWWDSAWGHKMSKLHFTSFDRRNTWRSGSRAVLTNPPPCLSHGVSEAVP